MRSEAERAAADREVDEQIEEGPKRSAAAFGDDLAVDGEDGPQFGGEQRCIEEPTEPGDSLRIVAGGGFEPDIDPTAGDGRQLHGVVKAEADHPDLFPVGLRNGSEARHPAHDPQRVLARQGGDVSRRIVWPPSSSASVTRGSCSSR